MKHMHSELFEFYDQYVRLTRQQRNDLALYRDRNIDRLYAGLDSLGYPRPVRTTTQGSIAMKTANQHPAKDYDIDEAIIFEKDDLPASPLDARKRVCSAMVEGGGNFKVPPEARTNAVTVWYQEGHHVDLAVHRRYFDQWGNEVIEHAGASWTQRDPVKITNWFHKQVDERSPVPEWGATVEPKQMRRMVQLLKKFSKAQGDCTLPGGLLISVLVAERYVSDCYRDDVAFYQTMCGIHARLTSSLDICNPIDNRYSLTYKDEYIRQVERFRDKLGIAIELLNPIHSITCTQAEALAAWASVFRHPYWDILYEDEITAAKAQGEALRRATQAGSLYTTAAGTIKFAKPAEPAVPVRPHRFYGES